MQSMNQSLIALLAHNRITYDQALESSWDPDDLSLKLRKMFPTIEERFREGAMAPSPADFSEITGLLETKRLYEEMEERHKVKVAEKDDQIATLEQEIADLRATVDANVGGADDLRRQLEQAQAETARLRDESQQKIASLNERIKSLNQQIQDGGKGAGFFKR